MDSARSASSSLESGYRFQPTDNVLVNYYLRKKICGEQIPCDVIPEIEIYRFEPWLLPDKSRLKSNDEWYFFSVLDKKSGTGSKTNRTTDGGTWKTTGNDKPVYRGSEIVGMKKILVYHDGRHCGLKSPWVMHEYRLIERLAGAVKDAETYVLCKIMKKNGSGSKSEEEKDYACLDGKYVEEVMEEPKGRTQKLMTSIDGHHRDIEELKGQLATIKADMEHMQLTFEGEMQNLDEDPHFCRLVDAASTSRYERVRLENRQLLNEVQDLKGNIRVYCRVRPFLGGQTCRTSIVDEIKEEMITVNGHRSFKFNKVYGPSATQGEVFSDARPLVSSVLDGYNVCILAYGQTGSGKTYTMTGPKDLTEDAIGVSYRSLNDLFLFAEQRKDSFKYDFSVQMIEIYNEQVRDLLVPDGCSQRLNIYNSSQAGLKDGLNVPDAKICDVTSASDVIQIMTLGHSNRAVGVTALNDRSSRSHSCLTVHVRGKDLTSEAVYSGCMHLVDPAGSERVSKSGVTGDRLKESQHINKSLSALGDVISSLAQKSSHVPYRNNKLTQLLQDSLGGQAKTLMFVHISPEADAVGETISTLKFAERVATVELGAARVNKDTFDVTELQEQIADLEAVLAKKEREPGLFSSEYDVSKPL